MQSGKVMQTEHGLDKCNPPRRACTRNTSPYDDSGTSSWFIKLRMVIVADALKQNNSTYSIIYHAL